MRSRLAYGVLSCSGRALRATEVEVKTLNAVRSSPCFMSPMQSETPGSTQNIATNLSNLSFRLFCMQRRHDEVREVKAREGHLLVWTYAHVHSDW